MLITKAEFGLLNNENIDLYTLKNKNGLQITIMNYGATITSILVPDKDGVIKNIACGFDTLESYFSKDYLENSPYFGGTIGRYCSQIKDGTFNLNGMQYHLTKNCNKNNLHGGEVGFDKKLWSAEIIDLENTSVVKMTLISYYLEEGFPGNVEVSVIFSLNDDNELKIEYSAIPDEDTPLALTNHTYFNLNGFTSNIEQHSVSIKASKRQAWDETGAGTSHIVNLEGQVDDLRSSKKIGDVHKALNDGFEHYYVFDNKAFKLEHVAQISCPDSGRLLTVSTTEPGMLFYTGKYTSDKLKRENGQQYGKYRGFCCETHRCPNGPNIKNSLKSITKAKEGFKSITIFKFGW